MIEDDREPVVRSSKLVENVYGVRRAFDRGELRGRDEHNVLSQIEERKRRVGDGDAEVDNDVAERLPQGRDRLVHQLGRHLIGLFRTQSPGQDHGPARVVEHGAEKSIFERFLRHG